MVFGTPKQDIPMGLLAKSNAQPAPVEVPAISNEDILDALPQIQAEVLKQAVSEVVQKYRQLPQEVPPMDAAYRESKENAKQRYQDVLLPAVNSAQSLAASAEHVTPELLAAKLRYERTKALQAQRAVEKPVVSPKAQHRKYLNAGPQAAPSFRPAKKAKPVRQVERLERKSDRKKASAIPDTWLDRNEKWCWWLAFGTSVLLYMGIATFLIWAFIYDDYPMLTAAGASIATYFIVHWFYQARSFGRLQESGVCVSDRQFGELKAEAEDIAEKLGLKKLPLIFVAKSGENAEIRSLRLLGQDVVIIPGSLAALAYQDDLPSISYLMARELVKIKQKHGRLRWETLPARSLPLVGSGYSQACVLSCDRAAAFCKPEGAVNGLKLLAVGKTLYLQKAKETLVPVDEAKTSLFGHLLLACAKVPTFTKRFQQLMLIPVLQ